MDETSRARVEALHDEIGRCRICEPDVKEFDKPDRLDRGEVGRLVVIGQGPGGAELKGPRAFAGQSGRRLDEWLVSSGADARRPRAGIYLTSIIKCVGSPGEFPLMAKNCAPFLERQISQIRPALIITLGKRAYEVLRVVEGTYEDALCRPQETADFVLVTPFGFHYSLMHWPHPSGLNRWLNEPANRKRLDQSFDYVRQFVRGER